MAGSLKSRLTINVHEEPGILGLGAVLGCWSVFGLDFGVWGRCIMPEIPKVLEMMIFGGFLGDFDDF